MSFKSVAAGLALSAALIARVAADARCADRPAGTRPGPATQTRVSGLQILGSGAEPDENWRWWGGFSLPIIDGPVHALTLFHGELVAAGSFAMAGGQRVNGVARWRDGAWQPLGAGFDGEVFALAVFQDRLVAGGQYGLSGEQVLGPVAVWDEERWTPLGVPVEGRVGGIEVRALFLDGATLVAGGRFDRMANRIEGHHALEVQVANIARWDGAAWSAIGAGFDGPVNALGSHHGALVAAGDFLSSGTVGTARIASWDGSAWHSVGDGIPSPANAWVSAVAELRDTLFVAGAFADERTLLRFGGTSWDAVPGESAGEARGLYVDGDSLILVGSLFRIGAWISDVQSWNGTSWTRIGETSWPAAETAIRYLDRLVVGGRLCSYWAMDAEPTSNVVAWDGSGWDALERADAEDHGLEGYVQSLASYHGSLVAAGSLRFRTSQGWSPTQPVARWDGVRWHAMREALSGRATSLAVFRDQLIVGGNLFDPDAGIDAIARWDGQHWHPLGLVHGMVEALAVLRDTLYAAGSLNWDGTSHAVARFDGTSWQSIAPVPYEWPRVLCMGIHRGRLYVGGQFDSLGGVAARNVATWDGASWEALGDGVNGEVDAFASTDSGLVVGGTFFQAGGAPAYGLARWDGGAWQSFPGLIAQRVRALAVSRGQLFVTADLLLRPLVPGVPAGTDLGQIARWDGVDAHPLGTGANGRLMALVVQGDDLFVGGDLSEAGGRAAFRIARWALAPHASAGTMPAAWETATPNPFSSDGTRLEFSLATAATVRVSIHDVAGREVARPVEGSLGPGIHDIPWTGRDADGRRLTGPNRIPAVKRLVLIE